VEDKELKGTEDHEVVNGSIDDGHLKTDGEAIPEGQRVRPQMYKDDPGTCI